jgi:hypothetical protein
MIFSLFVGRQLPEERPPPRMPTLMHGVIAGSIVVRDATPLEYLVSWYDRGVELDCSKMKLKLVFSFSCIYDLPLYYPSTPI